MARRISLGADPTTAEQLFSALTTPVVLADDRSIDVKRLFTCPTGNPAILPDGKGGYRATCASVSAGGSLEATRPTPQVQGLAVGIGLAGGLIAGVGIGALVFRRRKGK